MSRRDGDKPVGCKWCGVHVFDDPDTGAPVSIDLYKTEGGGVFGVDSSYLEQDAGPVYEPFDGNLAELDDEEGDEGEWAGVSNGGDAVVDVSVSSMVRLIVSTRAVLTDEQIEEVGRKMHLFPDEIHSEFDSVSRIWETIEFDPHTSVYDPVVVALHKLTRWVTGPENNGDNPYLSPDVKNAINVLAEVGIWEE